MADVLIVCVREDEPQAKALAEMFEAAGFSIGGAPSSDGALRSSGTGLIVWSQAAIRSRPFLDAAQRVINAEKAVVASLIEPPPPSSVGDSPVFDLSSWDGDPNDPALDPLFFAVDRMVNAARASVGAAPAAAEPYASPRETALPRTRTPAASPAPTPSYVRTPPPPPADPLGSEAEHWRAIRDSRDPTDFMDYLARYGPSGAFAEVAELRLKQLTSRAEPRQAPPPPPRATPRPELPQTRRLEVAPTRRPDAPPRRPDPPRRFERSYDRTDLREPPRESGGAMRTFVLIALLGGGALAGGLYFGGGMPNFATAPAQEEVVDSRALDYGSSQEPASAEDIASVPLSTATEPAPTPRRTEIAARTEPERPAPAQRQPETERPPPAPVTSWSNDGQGGPVSLRPGETSASPASTSRPATTPTAPPTAPAASLQTSTTPLTQPAATPRPVGSVVWTQRPSPRRISDLYPDRALRDGVGGRVELDCRVLADLSLTCSVASETPTGMGFGRAALGASNSYRARSTLSDGASSIGTQTRIAVQFQAPPQ